MSHGFALRRRGGALAPFLAAVAFGLAVVVFASADGAAQELAQPLLHPLLQDHAVVQRDRPFFVSGWTQPRALVTVRLDGGSAHVVRADRDGAWQLTLPALSTGGPHTLTAEAGSRTQTISDVLAGDVFLCSGQSNMEFPTRSATNSDALLQAPSSAQLRLFHVARQIADQPQRSFGAHNQWTADSAEAARDFSAVCYFFGRALQRSQPIPIGLISAAWGGTPAEAWMSGPALRRAGRAEEVEQAALFARAPHIVEARFSARMRAWRRARDRGVDERWSAPDHDDRGWAAISPEGFWEDSGVSELAPLDGIVWFRTAFTLSSTQAALGGQLELGPADDIDSTFVNGHEIGGVAGWDTPRVYTLAPSVLRAGRNVFAASVLDTGGGGGFWGPAGEKILRLSDGTEIPLSEPWRYRISARLSETGPPPRRSWDGQNAHAALYNAMIAPIGGYGVRAVLWYQGESNADAPEAYARLLPAWMADWRGLLGDQDLEFYIVQLSAFGAPVVGAPERDTWGRIRDVQRRVAAADDHAALAVSIDLGDRYDIHPTQKLVLAERLARLARRRLYGENIEESGPIPVHAAREGDAVRVTFSHGPLAAHSGGRPISFELCNGARVCRFADAIVRGEGVLIADASSSDAYVRYCWGDSPICNLYNEADLPASPFELIIE